jgi:hypothetical protein
MDTNHKILLRTAERISSHLQRLRAAPIQIELPDGDLAQCRALIRQIELCTNRNWPHASGLLKDRLEPALERCSDRLREVAREVSGVGRLSPLQSVGEVFKDLVALSDEFEGAAVDGSSQTVSVTTDPIVLEEIDLGPFDIRLHWDRIGERRPYEVVALNPNPAGESDETTHPHVKGDQLCEGDGQVAIVQALRTGRLLDFFQIVNGILDTYNSGSAYVSLANWNGSPCADCGDVVCEDDRFTCENCGDPICRDCLDSCGRCDSFCCRSCSKYCRACEEPICSGCQRECSHCHQLLCRSCISETGLCEDCQENHDAESFDEDEDPSAPTETETPAASPTRESDPLPTPSADAV